jgi:hypothetical protein
MRANRFSRLAGLVEQLATGLEPDRIPAKSRQASIVELDSLWALLDGHPDDADGALAAALWGLRTRLAEADGTRRPRVADAARNRRLARHLRRIAAIVAAGAALWPMAAAAAAPAPVLPAMMMFQAVGDTVVHPITGANVTVVAVVPNGVIVTGDLFILTNTVVGAVLPSPTQAGVTSAIASQTVVSGRVVSVTLANGEVLSTVTALSSAPGGGAGGGLPLPAGVGDVNAYSDVRQASGGGGGRTGALFVSAGNGGAGARGADITVTVPASNGNITTTTNGRPGIIVASVGGNGGSGGNGYLGASGGSGGRGGEGGHVNLTSLVGTISTTGNAAHGVVAQSRAGVGGPGGSGYAFSSGGTGGAGSAGGNATVTNYSNITTRGVAAHGVFAQSLGGGAGSGGGSYGIFGDGGAGNTGGRGGTAHAINYGVITTLGNGSSGVTARSVGGIGGDAGNAVGLVTFSSDGAAGGNGGTAIVEARAGSDIRTEGAASYGLFAQSVGGGGGEGGFSVGLATLGSGGGTGGNGGVAQVFAADGTRIETWGEASHGIFAQSIGGGGGNGGISGALVAIGSRGNSGGTGDNVTVESGSTIIVGRSNYVGTVLGRDARGIFAQSIGGGGGNALGTGGAVALGGQGGAAGGAGTVTVTTSTASDITTWGRGGDGIFAQSVGGGGGTGSSSGGIVSLGGSGAIGGNGNIVTVTNNGRIETHGDYARGIFAQSVGGGGGAGGDGGGLVSLGGSGTAASTGAAVTVTNNGAIETFGARSHALQVQSVGGGGGDGGSSGGVFLAIGGSAGAGAGSGLVTVNNSNNLTTHGPDAHGVFAQSVGGGGGNGGIGASVSVFAGVAIGGTGGSGGVGGNVDVNFFDRTVTVGGVSQTVSPVIYTTGDRSRGVFAQSVGGGGGSGGFATQTSFGYAIGASAAIGGRGGTGGTGGNVWVDGDVTIVTDGDFSEGLFVQSVGGGGGAGGFALSLAFSGGETISGAFALALGGAGAAGGAAGEVRVNSGGAIQTDGQFSTGLVAQSIGGGGGAGGWSVAVSGSGAGGVSGSVSVGIGGSGAAGGDGNLVDASFDGTILTTGDDSGGALIQSVGGGGGAGGFNVSAAVSFAGTAGVGASVGLGGSGGAGGIGGTVTGHIRDAVETRGDRSAGVIIQSVGGGGGQGGFNISGSIGGGGSFGGGLSVGLGGSGESGGNGGIVTGSADSILTRGDQSGGLLVQSVGGGGGSGGFNVSGSIGGGGTFGGAGAFGLGGAGGDGGDGLRVRGDALGAVYTMGNQSAGVVVQSLGGGGGSGGFNVSGTIGGGGSYAGAVAIGLGGAGGGGGHAGEVDASAVDIVTLGDQSGGFLVQSVGGGGGAGGFNVSGNIVGSGGGGIGLSVGLGGAGGTGGNASRVGGTVVGDVTTLGDQSSAIVAQSLGGGGGSGAFNISGGISANQAVSGSVNVGVGGSGGGGGWAGDVGLSVTGVTQTAGAHSDGILAQSVGGGGGSGGFNVSAGVSVAANGAGTVGVGVGGQGGDGGDAGIVTLNVNVGVADPDDDLRSVLTLGDFARGITAQSLGGGGGNGGFNVTGGVSIAKDGAGNIGVGVGGGGGRGGDGRAVTATLNGDIETRGDDASALLIQSVGGGGGAGGFNITGGIAGSKTVAGNLLVGVGGFGGGGGEGGVVTTTFTGDILTVGDRSFGASIQSIGGGGGQGGFNVTGGVSLSLGAGGGGGVLGVGVGGFGGDGGLSGDVTATLTGDIITFGDDAHAALIQSVGGGGGAGGFNITGGLAAGQGVAGVIGVGLGGFGGGGGRAGVVNASLTGDVNTVGDGSYGALIQSVGGGGGAGGMNITGQVAFTVTNNASVALGFGMGGFGGLGGRGETVTASVIGDYQTEGDDADGVTVQSIGGGGGAGGLNVTGNIALGLGTSGTASIGIGGFGGGGGNSGAVTLTRTGDTFTSGANSDGIIVQSVAGGGGAGGLNVSGGIAGSMQGSTGGFGFGLGGFGGGGGDALGASATITGNVIADGVGVDVVHPEINITGLFLGMNLVIPSWHERSGGSHGVLVQSVGGGGGAGGLNVTGQISLTTPGGAGASRSAAIGIGGFGGGGGDAGEVDLIIRAPGTDRVQVVSAGDDRVAAGAQSIGGGGGAGGINVSGAISMDGQLVAGIGGFGGAGGLARDVRADVDADLFAGGTRSRGLLVQSVGGGGGAGGINISGGFTSDPATNEPSLVFGLGGFGGAGNISGNVTARQNGQIWVEGVESNGILVQSVAGGGGAGGLNVAANISLSGGQNRLNGFAFAAGMGGNGGAGADAGSATLTSNGDIIVNARSVVDPVTGQTRLVATDFNGGSVGVLVQSIGGGGGTGGINATGAIAPMGQPVAIGIGGFGGAGGHGGDVTVTRGYLSSGAADPHLIRTFGAGSTGLMAQSVGGGGGNAQINLALAATGRSPNQNPLAATIGIGGNGGDAGNGATVRLRHAGDIFTTGDGSDGIHAQSLGGGGGSSFLNISAGLLYNATSFSFAVGGRGGAAGTGGDVFVDHDGDIGTEGVNAAGIRAQSIGGGGGNASFDLALGPLSRNNVNLTLGRLGGTGGGGGGVTVTSRGQIETDGRMSSGVLAQSIGGGGGSSGSFTVGASFTSGTGNDAASYSAGVSVGLEGGSGATGGRVEVDNHAQIVTRQAESRGILAQSIGGGGGVGGTGANAIVRAAGAAAVAVGGTGGTGGAGGEVHVDNDGRIATLETESDGILAQSIGGGGGVGGHARTLALMVGGSPGAATSNTASVIVGGSGGTGGEGLLVDVVNRGVITTEGASAYGIRAQSIGGGGGIGGAAINARLQGQRNNNDLSINIGGSGGSGGGGGTVNVLNEGVIWTQGRDAAGISANSIGGGGGNAGLVLDVVAGGTTTEQVTHRLAINVGGSGGTGGTGGNVTVINRPTSAANTGLIITEGEGAYGIFAQSLGGGGGNGSTVLSLTGMRSGADSFSFGLNFGGDGGAGNRAGVVTVENLGVIDTTGAGAHGIFAQSLGGGGGNGGLAIAGNFIIGAMGNAPLITIGGAGGSGGDGGAVIVNNSGSITTRGAGAHGILAQSIGGGGGNASMGFSLTGEPGSLVIGNAVSALIGALNGGAGGIGGTVTVNHTGDITVLGDGAMAIKAESINGGGGSLDITFDGITGLPGVPFIGGPPPPPADPLAEARAGADGASGMNAGLVTVNTSGTFGVGGDHGVGAFIQSLGGGGGTVNLRATLAPLNDATVSLPAAPLNFGIDLGGVDGVDNEGGDIRGSHDGALTTVGEGSPGALFQSIGGGGGRGLLDLEVPAGALLGEVSVSLGGVNGMTSDGGDINRTQIGRIATAGDLSPAAILQSIGGGGGFAVVSVTGAGSANGAPALPTAPSPEVMPGLSAKAGGDPVPSILPGLSSKTDPVVAAGGPQVTPALTDKGDTLIPMVQPVIFDPLAAPGDTVATVTLGAVGGSGNDGGAVTADFSGGAISQGDHSPLLVVQSIGGGGGAALLSGVNAPIVNLGGTLGADGDGGAIDLVHSGDLRTSGLGSHGLLLQSIGGGGGAVFGTFDNATVNLSAANSGSGGSILLDHSGAIVVTGDGAFGVIAQSIGGGGGWVDGVFAGTAGGAGAGGAITLDISGMVFAPGAGSTAVFAQSLGGAGAGDITILSDDLVRGGTGDGVGVRIEGGASNLIRTSGSLSAVSGLAVDTGTGDDRIENTGLIIGNIDLGSGANAVLNDVGGTFLAFNSIDLRDGPGSTGTLTNAGEFLMGLSASRTPIDLAGGATFGNLDAEGDPSTNLFYGARVINTVALDGDYVQTDDGHLAFDVAFGPYASDRVNVTGDATVDGTGEVILTWLENSNRVTLFATGGAGVDQGLEIEDTLAMDYRIEADADGVHLAFNTNFGQDFLNRNGRHLGLHMDSAIAYGGSSGIGQLMALIGNLQVGDEDVYAQIFNELNPEPLLTPSVLQFSASRDFADQIFACGSDLAPADGRCVWAQVETGEFEREGDSEYFGINAESVARFRTGFEQPIRLGGGGWMVGGALGYDDLGHNFVDGGRAVFEGDGFHGGLGLRRTAPDGAQVGVSVSAGWQVTETTRLSNVFQLLQGESGNDSGYVRADAEVARIFGAGGFYVRPALRGSVTALHRAGFSEEGMAGLGVEGYADTDVIGTLNPEIGFGFRSEYGEASSASAAITIGGVFHSDDELVAPMRLLGSNPDALPAYIATPIDEQAWRVGADIRFESDTGLSLRLNYVGEYGEKIESHTAGVNFHVKF